MCCMNDGFELYIVSVPQESSMSEDMGILMVSVSSRAVQKAQVEIVIRGLFGITPWEIFLRKVKVVGPTTCLKQHVDNFYMPALNDLVRRWNWEVHPYCALVGGRVNGKVEYRYPTPT